MPVVYLLNPCHHGENLRVEQPTDVIPKDTFHIRQLRRPLTHTPLLSVIYIYVVENLKGRNKRTAKQNQKPRRLVLVLEEHDRAAAASKQRSESSLNFSDCRRRRRGPFSTRRVLIQWRRGRRSVAFLLGSLPRPNPSSTQNVSVFFFNTATFAVFWDSFVAKIRDERAIKLRPSQKGKMTRPPNTLNGQRMLPIFTTCYQGMKVRRRKVSPRSEKCSKHKHQHGKVVSTRENHKYTNRERRAAANIHMRKSVLFRSSQRSNINHNFLTRKDKS